jgi:hypothetical protein
MIADSSNYLQQKTLPIVMEAQPAGIDRYNDRKKRKPVANTS